MRLTALSLLLTAALSSSPLAARDIETEAAQLRDRVMRGNDAWAIVESLTTETGPRLPGSPAEAAARDWAVHKLKALGFSNVRIESFSIPGWQRGAEEAAIVTPYPQPLKLTAIGFSGATPDKGIEADVLRFPNLAALEAAPEASVRGKIVYMTHAMPRTQDGSNYGSYAPLRTIAPSLAARKGAAAILIRSLGTSQHRSAHTGATLWEDGVTPIPAAALTLPDADQLDRVLARNDKLRLWLRLTPRHLGPMQSGNVIAEIPGSEPGLGVVLAGGHLDSWDLATGAIDDGAGVAVTTAAAKAILDSGQTPRRTIRIVLFGAEEIGIHGGRAYAARHGHAPHALVGESDFGAGRVLKLGSRVRDADLPAVAAMQRVLAPLGVLPDHNERHGGPDVQPLEALGVPVISPAQDGLLYFDLHHTADDTLDKINRADLDQNTAVWAVILWIAANAESPFDRLTPKAAD